MHHGTSRQWVRPRSAGRRPRRRQPPILLTAHVVRRYRSRVCPHLSPAQARRQLVGRLVGARPTPVAPRWWCGRTEATEAWVVFDDHAISLVRKGRNWQATTCVVAPSTVRR